VTASVAAPKRSCPTAAAPAPNCVARSTGVKNEVSQIRARKESLEQVLAHRTYTTDSVKRAVASLEKGQGGGPEAARRAADYVEVEPQFEKPAEEFLHEELDYVVVQNWEQAETRSRFHPRRTRRAARRSWCIRNRTAMFAAICPSRRSVPRPASPRGLAIRCASRTASRIAAGGSDCRASASASLADDRAAAQRIGRQLSAPLLPVARWRLLSRPYGDGRQEDRRRSPGDEARSARTHGCALRSKQGRAG